MPMENPDPDARRANATLVRRRLLLRSPARKLFGRLTRPTGIKRRRNRGACVTRYGVDADERCLISRAITQVCSMRGTREGGPPVANPSLRSRRRCAASVAGGDITAWPSRDGRGSDECAGPAGPAASRLSIEAGVAYTLLRYGSTAPHTGSLCTRPRHMRSAARCSCRRASLRSPRSRSKT